MQAGDLILAKRGLQKHSLSPDGVHINISPFLRGKAQFTYEEAQMCRKIVKARIHIERENKGLKTLLYYLMVSYIQTILSPRLCSYVVP